MQNGRGGRTGACPWWEGTLETEKKEAVRGNFNLFHLCFTNEISWDRHTLHTCKMEGGRRTGACPWWEGWGPCPPPRK